MRHLAVSTLLLSSACVAGGGQAPPPPESSNLECQIQSQQQQTPGYPFDLTRFRTEVLPTLTGTCANASCHGAPDGKKGFKLFADAAPGNCDYARTFNAFKERVDLNNPSNSKVYLNPAGDNPAHPLKLGKAEPRLIALLAFLEDAARTLTGTGGGTAPPPTSANPFDYTVYQNKIQPLLDNAEGRGCAAGCHGGPQGLGGFKIVANPAPGSPEMEANFNTITALCDLTTPETSKIYLRATNRHSGGASSAFSSQDAQTMLAWIADAKTNAPPPAPGGGAPTPNGCAAPANFDVGVFRDEIMPILDGTVDLNNRADTRTTIGCTRGACHGQDRTGGALVLKTANTAAQNLASFACFVSLTSPASSEILQCPLNQPGCRRSPHPGQQVFANAADKNYQRILSYLYGAKTVATPLDFAFFSRRINPLFNDLTAVAAGSTRTCADGACHGTSVAGQPAPNGSNFPILSNASDKNRLLLNFAAAGNFTNFLDPRGSSLFLYPTNEVANLANGFATGLPHPGGADLAIDSPQARDILRWSGGLRPDGQGRGIDWLVAGDFSAAAITDPTAVDEVNAAPSIFDRSGAPQFNNGEWDGLFSDDGVVNLNESFPRAAQSGRVAYAVAYLINTTAADINAEITLVSPNAVKLYVGKQPILQASDARAGVTGLATLPAFSVARTSTRILVKVFQRASDQRFEFQLLLRDEFGNPLTDLTRELVVKLSPNGGI